VERVVFNALANERSLSPRDNFVVMSARLLVFMAALLFATAKITNPGDNSVLNQQKAAHREQQAWLRGKQTLFSSLSFIQHCDCKAVVRAGGYP